MCVFVLVGASFSLNEGFLWFFIRKKDHTALDTIAHCRQPHRISKHLLALSTSSRLSEHASPTRFNNGVRVG
jgi:hypothetical protein